VTRYFVYKHTVTAEEIDDLDHAGNYFYIKWMQHAAIAHSTANGWPPQKYIDNGAGWVARSHRITYLKPAYEGDALDIKTWVANMRSAISLRCYEIMNANGDMLASAETDWAFVNYARKKPVRIPVEVSSCFYETRESG
jgi:acyl-CoA thioester hydrolase